MSVRSGQSRASNGSYMDVASYTQHLFKEETIDYRGYVRRVSKYDIDRGTVDFTKLRREKEKDRTDNVKIKKDTYEEQVFEDKKNEHVRTEQKINNLATIKEKQEKERREFVRKQ